MLKSSDAYAMALSQKRDEVAKELASVEAVIQAAAARGELSTVVTVAQPLAEFVCDQLVDDGGYQLTHWAAPPSPAKTTTTYEFAGSWGKPVEYIPFTEENLQFLVNVIVSWSKYDHRDL